ncbi:CsbD family protein [Geobacter sp. SVR]|uniref:CsbD family protein n=1 Tax=Geobacter sp. SVR TaxID=2495594 RepID=UPI00143EF95D|nr:CsbD family protein [Geobacter sp. SVR]BCS52578.1 hypothetical protein GSVR_08860 [Geobacter sp. SVR]GCF83984.1 hypothetical protein GSbR_05840 [Geobacter sp. SVR]
MKTSTKFMAKGFFREIRGALKEIVAGISSNTALGAIGKLERFAGRTQRKIGRVQGKFGF